MKTNCLNESISIFNDSLYLLTFLFTHTCAHAHNLSSSRQKCGCHIN